MIGRQRIEDFRRAKEALTKLIDEARRDGKWLVFAYQEVWFSPDELASQNSCGNYVSHPANFSIRDPEERLNELRAAAVKAATACNEFAARIQRSKVASS